MQTRTIGIIGGGQLGRMLTLAAKPLGFDVIVINPSAGSPAAQVGAEEIVASLYDPKALKKLASKAEVITVEIEHLDAGALAKIEALGKPVHPSPATIKIIQDKLWQKHLLRKGRLAVADFVEINNRDDAQKALQEYGKMLIKTRHGAYDGRGNMVISRPADIAKAFRRFKDVELYAEKYVPFDKEIAVLVARDARMRLAVYPVVETIHQNNICNEVLVPARISKRTAKQALKLAKQTVGLLRGSGVFAIEMFVTKKGKVLINEIAPRVHNSGHLTIEACRTSQFEQHIRAITGLPLGSTDMVVPAAAMINILGQSNRATKVKHLDKALGSPHTNVHIYGKSPTKVERKMGHITTTGETVRRARKRAKAARRRLEI